MSAADVPLIAVGNPVPDFPNAACRDQDVEMFYPPSGGGGPAITKAAKRICGRCDDRIACLEWGLANETFGIWGGTTIAERTKIRRRIKARDLLRAASQQQSQAS